jgi:hypothetical protein
VLRRGHDRRSRRYHLQGNAAACTANPELSGVDHSASLVQPSFNGARHGRKS